MYQYIPYISSKTIGKNSDYQLKHKHKLLVRAGLSNYVNKDNPNSLIYFWAIYLHVLSYHKSFYWDSDAPLFSMWINPLGTYKNCAFCYQKLCGVGGVQNNIKITYK